MKRITQILKENHQLIIDNWETEVLKYVEASKSTEKIALYDHVPNILDDIIDILDRHDKIEWDIRDPKISQIEDNSLEHGRHRATSANYTADQILHEYMIFHNIIIEVLNRNNFEDIAIFHLLKCCIDKAMLKSIQAFTESIQEIQKKLVGTLAHDIRNPLAAARLGVEMLNHDAGEDRLERVKKMTLNGVDKSLEMLEGLLDSISVQAGEGMMLSFAELDLYPDLETIYQEACEVYSEEMILECEKKEIIGVFDAVAVRRLLENLISNAVKYGESEKPITIKVMQEDNNFLSLAVHNHGAPIPKEKQKEIFNFLRQRETPNSKKLQSWGIGLTLVKMATEAHGGDVHLESSEGFGTEFTIRVSRTLNKPGKVRTKLNFVQNS